MTEHLEGDAAGVARAAQLIAQGHCVALPTETVYGLAARIDVPTAVASIFTAKGRPADDPLIVHIPPFPEGEDVLQALQAQGLVAACRPKAAQSAARLFTLWPGPLTVILPRGPAIDPTITAGLDHVALRMPAHPLMQAVLKTAGVPLAAPSANRFGQISPTTARAVHDELDGAIAAVLDGGACEGGIESTVLKVCEDGQIFRLRPGLLTDTEIEARTGLHPLPPEPSVAPSPSPGTHTRHYAPTTPLRRLTGSFAQTDLPASPKRVALLSWQTDPRTLIAHFTDHEVLDARRLTDSGDAELAASRLYAALRALDASGADVIYVEAIPPHVALFTALDDRLYRAAAKS